MEHRAWDVVLYGASAIAALVVPLTTDVPLDREWAQIVAPAYVVATLIAVVLTVRRAGLMARAALTTALFAAVALVPLGVHAAARAGTTTDVPVKSDILVIEAAADALMRGENPYAASYDGEALATWPRATRTHFPYLPATLVFGVPRAAIGPDLLTDARIPFLFVTLLIAVVSLMRSAMPPWGRLRALQVLLVAATGAPFVFTSGKELPVLALLLASLVALDRSRPVVSGIAAGLAASAHQLAWPVLPFLALVRAGGSARRGIRVAVAAAVTILVSIVPFAAWDIDGFTTDAILFPLGYGQPADSEGLFTPGSALAAAFPEARWVIVLVLVVVAAVAIYLLARRRRLVSAADVARAAGILLLLMLLLAPRVRIAYFAFPLNLLVWSWLLPTRQPVASTPTPTPVVVGTGTGSVHADRLSGSGASGTTRRTQP
jgi:hypothetical protein